MEGEVVAGDTRVALREWGSTAGRPLVFWHGAGESSEQAPPLATALAAGYAIRTIALDAPGHGRTPAFDAARYRPSALAALAGSVFDALGLERAAFAGHSWGALVGCWFAARFPTRVDSLVLLEGGHVDFADLPDFDETRSLDERIEEARAVGVTTPPADVAAAMKQARFRAALPCAEVRTLRSGGHDLVSDPPDEVASIVGPWLTSVPGR